MDAIKSFGEEFVCFGSSSHLQNISLLLIGYRPLTILYDFLAKINFFETENRLFKQVLHSEALIVLF